MDRFNMEPACKLALEANFGSVEGWHDELAALAERASGWVLLTFQPREGTLVNRWVADRADAPAAGVPLLALDLRVPGALGAPIDWAAVHASYRQAVHAATEGIGADAQEAGRAIVLDVRRAAVFAQAPTMLPGARWFDPAHLAAWATGLPKDREIVVYCVHGHEVSRSTALRLRANGLDACYLRGGIDGWQARGLPVVPNTRAAS